MRSFNKIIPRCLLNSSEIQAIKNFAENYKVAVGLEALSRFLKDTFDLDMVLDRGIVEGFETDSSNLPGHALGLCRPASEREAAVFLSAFYLCQVPVTVSGGRSNLTGSATPKDSVILSTVKLVYPAPLIVDDERVRVAAGWNFEEMREEVLRLTDGKLCFPVDPTSRFDAAVGGAIACNASGFTPGEQGAMRHWVESLRFLLPDGCLVEARRGEIVSEDGFFIIQKPHGEIAWPVPRYLRPNIKNAAGPYSSPDGRIDLVDYIIGSEGIFGLVTECELRLAPMPEERFEIFFSLPDESDAVKVLQEALRRNNGDLSRYHALEYFGPRCRRYIDNDTRFYQTDDEVALYIVQPVFGDGGPDEAAGEWLEILAGAGCDIDEDNILLFDDEKTHHLFVEARHSLPANAIEVSNERGNITILTDTVVPPENFKELLDWSKEMLEDAGLDYLYYGHFGDCHLHFWIFPEAGEEEKGIQVYDVLVKKSAELGGVYSGEHGTGKRKRKDFLLCYGPEAADAVRASKTAVDPGFSMNRGNVVSP
ncbi:MAG: FAD-binding oxidoreductase [Candidatus Sumerlaeota bacterium]